MTPLMTTRREPGKVFASYSFISAARNPVPELRFGIAGTDLLGWQAPRNAAMSRGQALVNAAKFAAASHPRQPIEIYSVFSTQRFSRWGIADRITANQMLRRDVADFSA
ncbi:MAG: hypothetical protein J0H42_01490 [Rhizobiales bacterium]|nr:hypothetical protein [Hyphomicrobiales bacterium]